MSSQSTLSLSTPWNELLDTASDGGLESFVLISGMGYGMLTFQVWSGRATAAALEAAVLATRLFDLGGQPAHEIFEHCLSIDCVYRESSEGFIAFKGPVAGSLGDLIAIAEGLQ